MNRDQTASLLRGAHALLADALGLAGDQRPFPWQLRLLRAMSEGDIPRSLDVPTGLGKTATIAIWLLARALGGRVPRRLVYVVDRRAVVDQATQVAEELRKWVSSRPDVAEALGLRGRALPISTLRGQFVDNREWLEDPSLPAIVIGTVDMVGSRLLFEGYGTSRKMRPYHAALLGSDTLFALDEAHLVPPFESLIQSVVSDTGVLGARDPRDRALVPASHLLALSATGRAHSGRVFDLDEEDLAHPTVRQRLKAPKRITPQPLAPKQALGDALAIHAWALAEEGARPIRCVVFANRRDDAEAAARSLRKLAGLDTLKKGEVQAADAELLTGGRRVFERTEAARRLEKLGFVAGSSDAPERPAFLFATSAGEVGVDLDADHMVCDLVAWERMVQRLGRVNRRGNGDATVSVIVEAAADDGEARERHEAQVRVIESLPRTGDAHDGSPNGLRTLVRRADSDPVLASDLARSTTPAPLHPALDRPTLDAWSMTSLEADEGRPEVAPWLRGWTEDPPQTRLVWRAHLPIPEGRAPTKRDLDRYLEAAPPHTSEILETETYRAVDWLLERVRGRLKAIQKLGTKEADETRRRPVALQLDRAGALDEVWTLEDLDAMRNRSKRARERALHERTLVLDVSLAGLSQGLLDKKSEEAPPTADGETWLTSPGGEPPVVRFRVREVEGEAPAIDHPRWRERARLPVRFGPEDVERWLVVEKWRHDAATEEDRSAAHPQLLDEHQSWAAERAAALSDRLALPESMKRVVCIAARLHDEGKRAARWQRAFHAPSDGVYAKTRGPISFNALGGYRHEFGSLPAVEADPELRALSVGDKELVLHLVAAHHGFARPFIRTDGCVDGPPSALEQRAREIALRFFTLQDRWGPWGLAWWEALLRAADQQASRANDLQDEDPS